MKEPAIFLDRDGVIVSAIVRGGRPYPPPSVEAMEVPPDVPRALARLKAAGYRLVVVTNQPDVARGRLGRQAVEDLNHALGARLPIDEFRVCWHDDRDDCACRKPRPGLLLREPGHDLQRSVMVGDRWRDIEAGRRAGVGATVFIDRGYDEPPAVAPSVRVGSLGEAADWILRLDEQPGPGVAGLRVKLFADGADLSEMAAIAARPGIRGFTTNPSLMRKAGVADYREFAREVLARIPDRPVSFEVFSDDFSEMERQARCIAGWGPHVYVKIPVTNTRGEPSDDLIRRLSSAGVHVNVTAVLTLDQVDRAARALGGGAASCVSVFAGRIADTGLDPMPIMAEARRLLERAPGAELIWASPRELLNVFQADQVGCHIITLTTDILRKLDLVGTDLAALSLATVRMFYEDAGRAGLALEVSA